MGCGCEGTKPHEARIGSVEIEANRAPCWLCTAKHLGCASVAAEYANGMPASVGILVARARVLMGEALQGYHWHRSLAIGALALAAEGLALDGQADSAAAVKAAQKALEDGGAWKLPEFPECAGKLAIRASRDVVAAHLAEAAAECPDSGLALMIQSAAVAYPKNPAYTPPLENWLMQIDAALHPVAA